MTTELLFKILAAVAPAIVLTVTLVRKDRRPEPTRWLWAAVGLGVLAGPAVLLLGYLVLPDIPADTFMGAILSSFSHSGHSGRRAEICRIIFFSQTLQTFRRAF